MPIKKSIEDLPRSNDEHRGTKPSSNPFIGEAVAQGIIDREDPNHPKDLELAIPTAGPFRASWTSKRCNRALWYALKGEPMSNPPGATSQWSFLLGHTVHDIVQEILPSAFSDHEVEIEPNIDLNPIGIAGSAHADAVVTYKGERTLVEIKSINGFGFKRAATTFSGPPEGPRSGHVLQAGLAAKAYGCTQIVIVYFSLENMSERVAKTYSDSELGRFTAEWHYTVEELEPIIKTEVERVAAVAAAVDSERPIPRKLVDHGVPDHAIITEPSSGMWVAVTPGTRAIEDNGDTWMCGYCDFKDKCITDGA